MPDKKDTDKKPREPGSPSASEFITLKVHGKGEYGGTENRMLQIERDMSFSFVKADIKTRFKVPRRARVKIEVLDDSGDKFVVEDQGQWYNTVDFYQKVFAKGSGELTVCVS